MTKALLYVHGGSGNHGCEAIARMLTYKLDKMGVLTTVLTANFSEDVKYRLHESINLLKLTSKVNRHSFAFLKALLLNKLFKRYVYLDMLPYRNQLKHLKDFDVAIAIGGDTYSYSYSESNTYMHNLFVKKGMKTVLWGCSIDPVLLLDKRVLNDLKRFNYITARESITYNALKEHGLTNVDLLPDVAFALNRVESIQSNKIKPNTIGLNLSPLVMSYNKNNRIIINNFRRLIKYIIEETEFNIAFIPHVVWSNSDDRKVLDELYSECNDCSRVIKIDDCNCMELKDIISRCRMLICARTHASIAAYSSMVPTLVLGYSVKAKGIARDIWGTENNYILPVQSFKSETDLTEAFKWMLSNENEMRSHLNYFMPRYIHRLTESNAFTKVLSNGKIYRKPVD